MKYDGHSNVREHIMKMSDVTSQFKIIDMEILEGFLVHFIMTTFLHNLVILKLTIILKRTSGR